MVTTLNTISIKMFVQRAKDWGRYLFAKRISIIVAGLIGSILGLLVALFSKPVYTGNLTFVLSSETEAGGGLLALANQLGFSFGKGNNAFTGENIIELFRSKKMFQRALFQKIPANNQLLINQIGKDESFFDDWAKDNRLQHLIPFIAADANADGVKDSLIGEIYKYALTHYFNLDKIEKDLKFYKITITSTDENVANYLPVMLVDVTAKFYTELKSEVAKRNLQMLQHEADSLKYVLDKSLQSSLAKKEQTLNVNTALLSAEAPAKKSDVQTRALQQAYQTVVQSMEVARITLQKVTPVYQVIDEPRLALRAFKPGLVSSFLITGLVTTFFFVCFLLVRKTINEPNYQSAIPEL